MNSIVKGIVNPKMKILSGCSKSVFLYSDKQKEKYLE